MADDKTKRGAADRQKVAGGQDHEVRHLAGKFGISTDQAKTLIEQHGTNRERLEAAARKLGD
jgi:hypothetical protein